MDALRQFQRLAAAGTDLVRRLRTLQRTSVVRGRSDTRPDFEGPTLVSPPEW